VASDRRRELRFEFPIHDILDLRYMCGSPHTDLSIVRIDAILRDMTPGADDTITERSVHWKKTRDRNPEALLSFLFKALSDQEEHLNFDYISMHQRVAEIFLNIRSYFIDHARDCLPLVGAEVPKKGSPEDLSIRKITSETVFPEDTTLFVHLTDSILNTCTSRSSSAARTKRSAANEEDDLAGLNYKMAGFTVENAGVVMSQTLLTEGDLELKKARTAAKTTSK